MSPVSLGFWCYNETPETKSYEPEAHYLVILKLKSKLHSTDYMYSKKYLSPSLLVIEHISNLFPPLPQRTHLKPEAQELSVVWL